MVILIGEKTMERDKTPPLFYPASRMNFSPILLLVFVFGALGIQAATLPKRGKTSKVSYFR